MKALTPLRMAMVGGGPGAFIGPVHRMAAELDGRIRLVAGSFSRDAARNAEAGRMWGIDQDRTYGDWRTMLAAEAARPDGARLVAVVTPNDTHFAISAAALDAGLHVMSDKPATLNLAQALDLARKVEASGNAYGLTYVYTGYPMVREAREIVRRGDLGAVRKIVVEYAQGWLSRPIERDGDRQAGMTRPRPGSAAASPTSASTLSTSPSLSAGFASSGCAPMWPAWCRAGCWTTTATCCCGLRAGFAGC